MGKKWLELCLSKSFSYKKLPTFKQVPNEVPNSKQGPNEVPNEGTNFKQGPSP